MTSYVIIGAGEAGVRAALTLRAEGFTGKAVLLSEEPFAPYERPPLSKAGLLHPNSEPQWIATSEQLSQAAIEFRTNSPVLSINKEERLITLSQGECLHYDKLLIATGARPRKLALSQAPAERVHYLRTLADCQRIQSTAKAGQTVALIGAGFIGLELAASLTQLGVKVHLIESQPRLLSRAVDSALAEILAKNQIEHGVTLHLNACVETAYFTTPEAEQLTLSLASVNAQSTHCKVDWLLIGIGSEPNTQLAQEAGLAVNDGLCVTDQMQTSDPHIYGAGDVCRFTHPLYPNESIRLESWRCAQEQGEIAAQNMMGQNQSYRAAPWFWSDQFDLGLQKVGMSIGVSQRIERQIAPQQRVVFELDKQNRLVAACGVGLGNGIAKDIKVAERLINQQVIVDASQLADPNFKLKNLLKDLLKP